MADTITKKRSVLLVDDDKFLVDMYAMKFTQQGYEVKAALSVNDAIGDLHAGFVPDAILFDLVMPERDGFSFIAAVIGEKLAPKAVKIALTNQNNDMETKKVLESGADQCILKASVIPSEVVNIVEKALSGKRRA